MSTISAGERIFVNRREYPLPKKEGTRDYVFYFVPASDPYGKGARYFFGRFYKNHDSRTVGSLEALVSTLHGEIEARRLTHIREIVIVTHGNALGLIFPLVNDTSGAGREKYRYVTAGSIAALQKELETEFPTFFQHRKNVISRLSNDSWITVRACNFGQSKPGTYSLYSFFGGRANVYAPKAFQFFGTQPILDGMRLETRLEVHGHLVKQRFLPKDTHTPERKDSIVRFLADPARFSEPLEVMSADLTDISSPETVEYQQVIANLNSHSIAAPLSTRLNEHGISLSNKKEVIVRVRDARWVIRDRLQHANEVHTVEYDLSERPNPSQAKLEVAANLADVHSAREFFPLQLFFHNGENNLWRGLLFVLAAYTEARDAAPAQKQKFDRVQALLDALSFGDGAGGIVQLFQEEGIELSPARTLSLVSESGAGNTARKTWLLKDGPVEYQIKLEHPASSNGIPAHTLTVYEHSDRKTALRREYELMAYLGADPDQPGTELLSYLDNLSFDELTSLIDYLRNPYKPEHALYLHHAVQAIERKQAFLQWFLARPEVIANAKNPEPLFELTFPYTNLSFLERDDKKVAVYDFETDLYWAEVKASQPPSKPFQTDLFAEQPLAFDPGDLVVAEHLEPESPSTDVDELRALERTGLEPFFTEEKFTFEELEQEDPSEISCQKFAELIELVKSLTGKSQGEIEAALKDFKLHGDLSLFTYYVVPKPLKNALDLWTVTGVEPGIAERVLKTLIERRPGLALGTFRLTPLTVHFTRALGYIGIATMVGEMFWNYLKELSNTLTKWEQTGKLTAVRQWVRQLELLTFAGDGRFPEQIEIDIGNDVVSRYFQEQIDEYGRFFPFVFAVEQMRKGYNEGMRLIEAEANEVLAKTDRILDDALERGGLDACKIQVLRKSGIIDPAKARGLIMREFARFILKELPKI